MTVETFRDYRHGAEPDFRYSIEVDDGDQVLDFQSEVGFPTDDLARAAGQDAELAAICFGSTVETIYRNGGDHVRGELAEKFGEPLRHAIDVVIGDQALVGLLKALLDELVPD